MAKKTIRPLVLRADKSELERALEIKVEELTTDLFELLPDEFQDLFLQAQYLNNEEFRLWEDRALKEVVSKAKMLPKDLPEDYLGRRAYCPLCRRGSRSIEGFDYPIGLEQHLKGQFGREHQCVFFKHSTPNNKKNCNEYSSEEKTKEREQKPQEYSTRKKNETVYKIHPTQDPELIDDNILFEPCRTTESLMFAEDRLKDLGLLIQDQGNMRSYTLEFGPYTLYADPRLEGKIKFTPYLKNAPKPRKTRGNSRVIHIAPTLTIYDRWKNGLHLKLKDFCDGLIKK